MGAPGYHTRSLGHCRPLEPGRVPSWVSTPSTVSLRILQLTRRKREWSLTCSCVEAPSCKEGNTT